MSSRTIRFLLFFVALLSLAFFLPTIQNTTTQPPPHTAPMAQAAAPNLAPTAAPFAQTLSAANGWQALAPGIEYREWILPTPNRVYVARLDRLSSNTFIESSLNHGALRREFQTIRDSAALYEESINNWPLPGSPSGNRTQVVVAINGSFVQKDGLPENGQIHGAWFVKPYQTAWLGGSGSGFVWGLNRQAFIGLCTDALPREQIIEFPGLGLSFPLTHINSPAPGEADVALYTSHYETRTPASNRSEILVTLDAPLSPNPRGYVIGTVTETYPFRGANAIPFDQVILSFNTTTWKNNLENRLKPGEGLFIRLALHDAGPHCKGPEQLSWQNLYAGVGGAQVFVRNGSFFPYDATGAIKRHPRTAIALNNQYIYFIVVDGRRDDFSIGMTLEELSTFLINELKVTWAINQDGGGSSTMIVNGQLMNNPSDACPKGSPVTYFRDTKTPMGCERPVVNGLMMAYAAPRQNSATPLAVGQVITLSNIAELRVGPGDNYAPFFSLSTGQVVTISAHPLNGVLARQAHWWKVKANKTDGSSVEGWLPESALQITH